MWMISLWYIIIYHADKGLDRVGKFFMLKPESVGKPNVYLGAKLRDHKCPNGVHAWTMSPSNHAQEAAKNCHKHLKEHFDGKYSLPKTAPNPFPYNYEVELDTLTPLD